MLNKLLFLLVLSTSITCYSQNLTIEEIVHLKSENIAGIEEYLSEKHWNLLSSQEETGTAPGTMIFAYNKNGGNDNAEAFMRCVYSKQIGIRVLNLQMHSQTIYNSYIAAIKNSGCSLVHSKIGADNVIKIYQGDANTFLINVKTKKDKDKTTNIYHIYIMSNADYNINYKHNEEVLPQVVDSSTRN